MITMFRKFPLISVSVSSFCAILCIFYWFSFLTSALTVFFFLTVNVLISAIMVVLARNPINALFFLIAAFFNSSIFLILLHNEFLAIVFVFVYIGAISVFFLFMVMMLNIYDAFREIKKKTSWTVLSRFFVLAGSLFFNTYLLIQFLRIGVEKNITLSYNLTSSKFGGFSLNGNVYELIGHFFYTYYSVPLLLISILLLVIMIGVIVLPVIIQPCIRVKKIISSVFLTTF